MTLNGSPEGTPTPPPSDLFPYPSDEQVKKRANLIIDNLHSSISQGKLSPSVIQLLERDVPRLHRDIIEVHLGMKPMASQIGVEAHGRSPEFRQAGFTVAEYLSHFPTGEQLGFPIQILMHRQQYIGDIAAVYNPELVAHIIKQRADLQDGLQLDPLNTESFSHDIELYLAGERATPNQELLYGLLLGVPEPAAKAFVEYAPDLDELYYQAQQIAQQRGEQLFVSPSREMPFGPQIQVVFNINGVRDKISELASQTTLANNGTLLAYLRGLRPADVPGFQYATSGTITAAEEQRHRETWEASGIEQGLNQLASLT